MSYYYCDTDRCICGCHKMSMVKCLSCNNVHNQDYPGVYDPPVSLAYDISQILLSSGYYQLDDEYPEVKRLLKFISKNQALVHNTIQNYLRVKNYLGNPHELN